MKDFTLDVTEADFHDHIQDIGKSNFVFFILLEIDIDGGISECKYYISF